MNDDELKKLFDNSDIEPEKSAKSAAMKAALQAFDETHSKNNLSASQGSSEVHRLTSNTTNVGSDTMNNTMKNSANKKLNKSHAPSWLYGGIASAAVLVLGVFLTVRPTTLYEVDETQTDLTAQPAAKIADTTARVQLEERVVAGQAKQDRPQKSQAIQGLRLMQNSSQPRLSIGSPVEQFVAEAPPAPSYQGIGRDRFESVAANPVKRVSEEAVSTFSIDVDTSSYSFVRRQLNQGLLPQKAAVRVEEMINYFPYEYPLPKEPGQPFSASVTTMDSPWKKGNKLVHIGIKGYELTGPQPRSNLVFLLDVSGSMNSPDKLPLVKQSMGLLLSQLQPEDTVAIVVYAGAAGTVLEPTPVKDKQKILAALTRLSAGGSTAGAAGIKLAYQIATSQFVKEGVNRIILATDGDFNVGINNRDELKGFVERKRETGIYLSVLGFGQGNYHDHLMQTLAQNGNGVAAYIDSLGEAQKVLVDEATSTLFPIASDVKIQVEFNPATVSEYRLVGYETRMLAEEDFNNDAVDAGDIGAGHSVTAIYEITPVGSDSGVYSPSRYTKTSEPSNQANEYGFLKLRYKLPGKSQSTLISQPIAMNQLSEGLMLQEAKFATAVAGFAQLLKGDKHIGTWRYEDALKIAHANKGEDLYGYRTELVQLIRKAQLAAKL